MLSPCPFSEKILTYYLSWDIYDKKKKKKKRREEKRMTENFTRGWNPLRLPLDLPSAGTLNKYSLHSPEQDPNITD